MKTFINNSVTPYSATPYKVTRRSLLAALVISSAGLVATSALPVFAHEADCPVCSLPVVQDTDQQDNEVKLRFGRKRLEYRCVYCALSEAQGEYAEGEVSIAAPSEKKGEPVLLKRVDGKWSAPEGVVFVAQKANHKYCQITYRAFHTRQGFEAWVKAHPDRFEKDVQPLTFEQMLAVAKPKAK